MGPWARWVKGCFGHRQDRKWGRELGGAINKQKDWLVRDACLYVVHLSHSIIDKTENVDDKGRQCLLGIQKNAFKDLFLSEHDKIRI